MARDYKDLQSRDKACKIILSMQVSGLRDRLSKELQLTRPLSQAHDAKALLVRNLPQVLHLKRQLGSTPQERSLNYEDCAQSYRTRI